MRSPRLDVHLLAIIHQWLLLPMRLQEQVLAAISAVTRAPEARSIIYLLMLGIETPLQPIGIAQNEAFYLQDHCKRRGQPGEPTTENYTNRSSVRK